MNDSLPETLHINHEQKTLRCLEDIFDSPKFCDVVFEFEDDTQIHAHRVILASQSRVFEAMLFGSNMREKHEKVIKIKDSSISSQNFKDLLYYVYTGTIMITEANAIPLVYLSQMYELNSLTESCLSFLKNHISAINALELYCTSEHINDQFSKNCLKIIERETYQALSQSPMFVKLPENVLISILQSEKLTIEELELFNLVAKWIKANDKNKEQTEVVMRHVRFSQIPSKDLVEFVKPTGLAPMDLYLQALEFQASPNSFDCDSKQFQPRLHLTKWRWDTSQCTLGSLHFTNNSNTVTSRRNFVSIVSQTGVGNGESRSWKIRVEQHASILSGYTAVGVISDQEQTFSTSFIYHKPVWIFCCCSHVCVYEGGCSNHRELKRGSHWKASDIITVTADTEKNIVYFYHNNQFVVELEGIPNSVKFCACIPYGQSITII